MASRLSEKSLENIALHYLQRFSTSVHNLRRVLVRRVDRRLLEREKAAEAPGRTARPVTREEALAWIDALLAKLQRAGLLDDARYARLTAESLSRRGQPLRRVQQKLRAKGLDAAGIEAGTQAVEALSAAEGAPPDELAVLAYAKRRRLGPFRRPGAGDLEVRRRKELASLARAGFPYALARRVVDAESAETLERTLDWEVDP